MKDISIKETIDFIAAHKPNFIPKIGIILGSGLGDFANQITDVTSIPYEEIPGFHSSTVEGHAGNLLLGYIQDLPVVCLKGRVHIYEGADSNATKILIRTLKLLGCEMVFITNAAGSLREEVGVGSLMLINDHINFQFTNVMIGLNDDEYGPRFFSMENAYDKDLRNKLQIIADRSDIKLQEGVYIAVSGPCFETPAEIKAFRTLGADAVGMSTVQEVIVARHCGLKVVAISAITNLASGMNAEELSHEQTLRCAKLATKDLINLILNFCKEYLSWQIKSN